MSSATDSTTDAKSPGYPEGERAIRTDLAACYRLAAHFRMTDITYTHISARLEGEEAGDRDGHDEDVDEDEIGREQPGGAAQFPLARILDDGHVELARQEYDGAEG